jgi:predicted amidophosphoribosyltransferase
MSAYDRTNITDGIAPDHYPTCPHCGNLCGKLARVCYDCGAHLYDDVTNAGRAKREDSSPHKEREDYP